MIEVPELNFQQKDEKLSGKDDSDKSMNQTEEGQKIYLEDEDKFNQ